MLIDELKGISYIYELKACWLIEILSRRVKGGLYRYAKKGLKRVLWPTRSKCKIRKSLLTI